MMTFCVAYLIFLYLSVAAYLIFGFTLDWIPFYINLDFTNHEKLQKIFYLVWPISFPISFIILLALIAGLAVFAILVIIIAVAMAILFYVCDLLFPPSRASLSL